MVTDSEHRPFTHLRVAVAAVVVFWLVSQPPRANSGDYGPFPPGTTVFVDGRHTGPENGTPTNPFDTIQEGLNAALNGDQVGVAPGTYIEHVIMKPGVGLVGNSAPTTTIDAGGDGSTVTCADARVEGFTITNAGGLNHRAVNCHNQSSPEILNNIITDNLTTGIFLLNSTAIVSGNTISGNSTFDGSCPCDALVAIQSSPVIVHNTIVAEDPNGNIDAIDLSYNNGNTMTDSFLVDSNLIVGRVWMSNINASVTLDNVFRNNIIISGNSFSSTMNLGWSQQVGTIANNTLIGGGGIFLQGDTFAVISNNIVAFGNTGIKGTDLAAIEYNNVYGNDTNFEPIDLTGVDGNISADPLFADLAHRILLLRAGSPCIDAGNNDFVQMVPNAIPIDIAGQPRLVDDPESVDTGVGEGPIADMGALEYPHGNLLGFSSDRVTLEWPIVSGAVSCNMYRGDLSSLVDGDSDGLPDGGYGSCVNAIDPDTTDTSFVDLEVPVSGTGFFYLLGIVDGTGAEGFLGETSRGLRRVAEPPCP